MENVNFAEILQLFGCVVTSTSNVKSNNLKDAPSQCGILYQPEQGVVLSHGSILADYCIADKKLNNKINNGSPIEESDLGDAVFSTMIDRRWSPCELNTRSREEQHDSDNTNLSTDHCPEYRTLACRFICAFKNEDFSRAVSKFMPESTWSFETSQNITDVTDQDNSKQDMCEKLSFNLLSYFVILKTCPLTLTLSRTKLRKDYSLPLILRQQCRIGEAAEIVSTPFGSQNPSVFFNTYSVGVVCNVSGNEGCWIVTDARCIPGSEGGALFTGKGGQQRFLAGIIVASLCWKNKEWVGFSMACSIRSVIESMFKTFKKIRCDNITSLLGANLKPFHYLTNQEINSSKTIEKNEEFLSSTVLIRVGNTWGSGVIVNCQKGIILTCSHVVKDTQHFTAMIKPYQGSQEYSAHVVYSNRNAPYGPLDIAVLTCPEATAHLCSKHIPKINTPQIGEKVLVIGHALFSYDLNMHPSITVGVVSKLIHSHEQLAIVQSTCAVHAGSSGGPLLNAQGDLIGIIVCNTVDKGSNACYPHLNLCVPAISLLSPLQRYLDSGDASAFAAYNVEDLTTKRLWALDSNVLGERSSPTKSKL
ncbi:peroxisomal leader peptide-processing protease-like [Physella acuta]|uniref:peroxisomal leader peptide-processing protease-like n=1 Tax=Physella acuta TaxID=109671 RepID=UPI0027DB5F25|nr:peroxisomal leader peptide-processing protease-like [Physella acuta]XP_059170651.1 peroxisomal leader peptide-processing protease-like [Physella acuta]XP_059170652.1 peroxisomal leader peptide-processing protease-like [Physella acuta]XP_059170653.1 peroxisomal leader peptide-processing protease-like [Physella acuta]